MIAPENEHVDTGKCWYCAYFLSPCCDAFEMWGKGRPLKAEDGSWTIIPRKGNVNQHLPGIMNQFFLGIKQCKIYGDFEAFVHKNALFGLVSCNNPCLPPKKWLHSFRFVWQLSSFFLRVKPHFAVFQVCRDRAAYFKSTGNKLSEAAEGRMLKDFGMLPRNLAWNLKMMVSKRNLLFQGLLFRFHVKFQGCILGCVSGSPKLHTTAVATGVAEVESWKSKGNPPKCQPLVRDYREMMVVNTPLRRPLLFG